MPLIFEYRLFSTALNLLNSVQAPVGLLHRFGYVWVRLTTPIANGYLIFLFFMFICINEEEPPVVSANINDKGILQFYRLLIIKIEKSSQNSSKLPNMSQSINSGFFQQCFYY